MNSWLLLIPAVIFHEFGHYIGYWLISKKRPKVYFNWIAFHVENREGESELQLKEKIIIGLNGIFFGLFFVIGQREIMLVYLLGSSFDLSIIYSIFLTKKEYKLSWNTLIKDIPCERCKNIKLSI